MAVTLGFTALVSMFAFLEELSDAAYGYQLIEIAIFVLSSTPRRLGEVLIFSTFMAFVILSLVLQDCFIFISKRLGELICQNKQ